MTNVMACTMYQASTIYNGVVMDKPSVDGAQLLLRLTRPSQVVQARATQTLLAHVCNAEDMA